MWPAVPRIIASLRSPARLFPELHGTHGPTVGQMLGEELAQQPLVRAPRCVVEPDHTLASEEVAERGARLGREHATRRREPSASRAERTTRGVAEHDGVSLGEGGVTLGAYIDGGPEAQLGDDVP